MEKYIQSYLKQNVDNELLKSIIYGLYIKDRSILQKAFGLDFNENMYARKRLEYYEKMQLDLAIQRINDNLDFGKNVYQKTKNYVEVTKQLGDKLNNPKIYIRPDNKSEKKRLPKGISILSYARKYQISKQQVEQVIEEMKEDKDFLLFAYYYGITRPKIELIDIYQVLDLDNIKLIKKLIIDF